MPEEKAELERTGSGAHWTNPFPALLGLDRGPPEMKGQPFPDRAKDLRVEDLWWGLKDLSSQKASPAKGRSEVASCAILCILVRWAHVPT